MRKNLTEIVFILDRSGSMIGLERDTIGGFNSMIEQQKKAEGEALISTVLFDNVSEVLHDRVNVKDIRPMTDRDYTVRGCTALLDAIGGAIHHIGNVHKYARPEDVPEHTMFVITTDGMENASRRYNSEKVKQMIERQKAKYGWEFLFLGANIDAVETASQFGIGADRAVNYQCDSEGTALNYEVVSEAISSVRCSAPLSADWKKRIDEDYKGVARSGFRRNDEYVFFLMISLKHKLMLQSLSPLAFLTIVRNFKFTPVSELAENQSYWGEFVRLNNVLIVVFLLCATWILAAIISFISFTAFRWTDKKQGYQLSSFVEKEDASLNFFMTMIIPLLLDDVGTIQGAVTFLILIDIDQIASAERVITVNNAVQ